MTRRFKSNLKAAFENTTMCARSHGPKEAYDYADRMYAASLKVLGEEMETLAKKLEEGKVDEVIKILRERES